MDDCCLKSSSVGTGPAARPIAVRARAGAAPGLFWLGGFKSDMRGTKAEALDAWAGRNGRAMVRFDYSGHGESGGTFAEGTIGRWLEESAGGVSRLLQGAAGRDRLVHGRLDRAAAGARAGAAGQQRRPRRSPGLVLIAPAVDFTEELMWKRIPPAIQQQIDRDRRLDAAIGLRAERLPDHARA